MKNANKLRAVLLMLAASTFAMPSAGANAADHLASTAAEVALDKVLKIADADGRILDNLFHRYPDWPVPPAKRVEYKRLLTGRFLGALNKTQRALVQSDCGGVYRKGDVCGFDWNPITCAQDVFTSFTYHSLRDDGNRAVIAAHGNTYTMVRENAAWKLDDAACGK
jgi:hypothetical protein